ncbi:MAG: diguanylate cyclase [Polyangiaceae bacterium]
MSESGSSSVAPPAEPVTGSSIVIADDDRLTRDAVCGVLRAHGYVVDAVGDGQAAVERVARGGVDLVLLDILMPRLSGLEACRLIKGMTSDSFLPVVLLTVKTDSASRVEGLKIGADDYVCKPFDERELIARVEAMLRIKRLHDHVAEARAKLEQLSMRDELTGLYNYRYLHPRMSEEFKRAERYHDPLACLVIDIDRLQAHNDAGGRALGDRIIRGVADSLRRSLREVDVVARFGGDEFLVLLPSTHFAGSVTVAERIWRDVAEPAGHSEPREGSPVTLSVGVALFPSRDVRTKNQLLRAADTALLHAKREGKNRVCVYQQQGQLYTPISGADDPQRAEPARSAINPREGGAGRAPSRPPRDALGGPEQPPRRGTE